MKSGAMVYNDFGTKYIIALSLRNISSITLYINLPVEVGLKVAL